LILRQIRTQRSFKPFFLPENILLRSQKSLPKHPFLNKSIFPQNTIDFNT